MLCLGNTELFTLFVPPGRFVWSLSGGFFVCMKGLLRAWRNRWCVVDPENVLCARRMRCAPRERVVRSEIRERPGRDQGTMNSS